MNLKDVKELEEKYQRVRKLTAQIEYLDKMINHLEEARKSADWSPTSKLTLSFSLQYTHSTWGGITGDNFSTEYGASKETTLSIMYDLLARLKIQRDQYEAELASID